MKKCIVKKLYKDHISIRDYLVERAINNKEGIIVKYQHWKMTIPLEVLEERFKLHNQKFESKYGSKTYGLYDFVFIPDYANQKVS